MPGAFGLVHLAWRSIGIRSLCPSDVMISKYNIYDNSFDVLLRIKRMNTLIVDVGTMNIKNDHNCHTMLN